MNERASFRPVWLMRNMLTTGQLSDDIHWNKQVCEAENKDVQMITCSWNLENGLWSQEDYQLVHGPLGFDFTFSTYFMAKLRFSVLLLCHLIHVSLCEKATAEIMLT